MSSRKPQRCPDTEDQIIKFYGPCCRKIGLAADEFLFDFFAPRGDGGYHIEYVSSGIFCFVATERDKETIRRETHSLEELMYWIFVGVAQKIASRYELNNRHPKHDFRRLLFAKAVEEIGKVSPEWQTRLNEEYQEVLQRAPFRDDI